MQNSEILKLMAAGARIKFYEEGGAALVHYYAEVDYYELMKAGLIKGLCNGSGFGISSKGRATVKPQIGDKCIVVGPNSNGANEHPAVITRVWQNENPWIVNVTCFLDHAMPTFYGSVPLYPSKEELKYGVGERVAYLTANV